MQLQTSAEAVYMFANVRFLRLDFMSCFVPEF